MKNKLVGVILIGILILSACSISNSKEAEQNSVAASSEESLESVSSTDQTQEDEFNAQMPVHSEDDDEWGYTDYFGMEGQTFTIEKDSSGEIQIDWTSKLGMLIPGDYVLSFQIRDIRNVGGDWDSFDYRVWFSVPQNDGESLIEKAVAEEGL